MRDRLQLVFAWSATVSVIIVCTSPSVATCAEPDMDAETSSEVAKNSSAYHRASLDDLEAWKASASLSVSLRAAWEPVQRVLPEREQARDSPLDRELLARFLGFVEGRLAVSLPPFWEEAFENAGGRTQDDVGFSLPQEWPPQEVSDDQLVTKGVDVRRSDGQWTLSNGSQSFTVTGELLKSAKMSSFDAIDALFDGGRCYFTLRGGRTNPFQLGCGDTASNRLLWKADVWAAGDDLGYVGKGFHLVSLERSGNTLHVFGVGDDCAYVESFSCKDGSALGRFCTRR